MSATAVSPPSQPFPQAFPQPFPQQSPSAWHTPLAQPAQEFPTTPLRILSGQVPAGLQGAYYQNGTGRLARGGEPVGHWFDGDGAILRVGFGEGKVTGTYRYVQTAGYRAESAAHKFLYGNYGMRYPGPLWEHMAKILKGTSIKNSANTSVLALPDKLLALWEGGNPHSLNLESLETLGQESLGWLKSGQPFSAHPLQDPLSGEIYNIGVNAQCDLAIYRCDAACHLIKKAVIPLKDVPLVHSFVMAGPYLVFLISPVKINLLPLLFNQQSYADSIEWRAERGTKIIVVDRESLEIVSQGRTDPWFQWHYGNGCVDADGNVRLDFARFDDFTHINQVLREVPTGKVKTVAHGKLHQLRINPKTGQVLSNECVIDRHCEFPQVPASQVGQPWNVTYLIMHRDGAATGQDWFGTLGRFDYASDTLTTVDLGEGYYGSEPLYVADRMSPERGWLLAVVYNSHETQSELWIFDAQAIAEPVCRLALPSLIPLGFHGTWRAA
ncbi:MAG: Lignostilbene-alpha,beta-dioxygenase-related protein [Phormidesmis priestleyi Ana]|uniref:Lignostilbene-alpha,beta-dioxygenase-related protein n=1 Tax=Phormidesmis priestleyi Ana TaxID=1666911 RepID=A0A0N8KNQ8_9CYAN|nr:MAG: Lignostilbene-alpha,beta-dioxygenase-related protein [Phormidesmis priestleyi Ana]